MVKVAPFKEQDKQTILSDTLKGMVSSKITATHYVPNSESHSRKFRRNKILEIHAIILGAIFKVFSRWRRLIMPSV